MNPVIEKAKAEALAEIRAGRPKLNEETALYVCEHCGASGEGRGWQMWHTCAPRAKRGVELRLVR